MPALGDEFRSAREARGLTLSDVAEQIHIRSVYLGAIENEDWPQIGAPVYVRGFIRTYARFLGLDSESAVQQFNQTVPPERPPGPAAGASAAAADRGNAPSGWAILGILVALALVAFVGYEWWQYNAGTAATPVAAVSPSVVPSAAADSPSPLPEASGSPLSSPSPAPSPSPSRSPGSEHQLAVRLVERSWLRVTVDGAVALEGLYPAGTSKTYTGRVVDLRAGNAGGVTVSLGGAPAKPLGKPGDVVEIRYTL